jgi:leader peptidase (prepilin peptidase) / N-methyltransferase
VPWPAVAAVVLFLVGMGAERIASVWPATEARRRRPSWRTLAMGLAAGAAGYGIAAVSHLPPWATLVHLVMLGFMIGLVATDLEQRRLPHLLLDPLIVVAVGFAFINPALDTVSALAGAAAAVVFLGVLAFVIRGGMALGDLYLAVPIGLTLGWPLIWSGLFTAAILAGAVSLFLVVTGRVGLRSYIAFGPYLVAGYVLTLIREATLLAPSVTAAFGS